MSTTPEASRQAVNSILIHAPEIRYSPGDMKVILEQPVSWDRKGQKLVSLGQYVARNLTSQAAALGVTPEIRTDPFPQPVELDRNELAKLSTHFFTETDQNLVDQDGYSPTQVIEEIRKRSPKGLGEMRMVGQDRQFIVDLIARGKMRVDPSEPDLPAVYEFPDFPY